MTKKVLKKLDEYKVENVVLSEELMANEEFCKELEDAKKYIVTGRRIEKVMLRNFIREIAKYTKYPLEKMSVLLVMNEYSLENVELMQFLFQD